MPERGLILASGSATRARLLRDCGVSFEIVKPAIDEERLKHDLRAAGESPRAQAETLAERKALAVSMTRPGLVIGADQMLALNGAPLDKPRDRADAAAQLLALRGRMHELLTAVALAEDGAVVWRMVDRPRLTMRAFSDEFVEHYLDQMGEGALASVGAYQLEGLGAQLFERVEGDFFSILGLPLLALLGELGRRGLAPQ